MDPIRENEDFNEEELFEDSGSDRAADSDSEGLDCEDAAQPQADPEKDDHGGSSAKSSLTMTAGLGLDAAPEPHDVEAEDSGDHLPALRTIAASMPAASGHIRMGSSVPVSIPHMNRWKKADAAPDSPTTQYAPATFVPPHQLSQVNEFMFSFTGDSPSVAIKRERLRARNAILKSTGFLEPGVQSVNNIGLQERNRLNIAAGGLSQALQPRQSGSAIPVAAAIETS